MERVVVRPTNCFVFRSVQENALLFITLFTEAQLVHTKLLFNRRKGGRGRRKLKCEKVRVTSNHRSPWE